MKVDISLCWIRAGLCFDDGAPVISPIPIGKHLQGDLPRSYKDGGAGKNPQAFFTTTEEINISSRLTI